MNKFVIGVFINALALWVAGWVLPGISITATGVGGLETPSATLNTSLAYLFIGLVFGVVNSLVKPIVKFLSFPVTILTLGLFTFVINAAMLSLTAWLSSYTPVHFSIDSFFWTAILAAVIISIVSMVISRVGSSDKRS